MYRIPSIIAQYLSYDFTTAGSPFKDISLSLSQKRYGIVGDNGVGKTTLLKILAKVLKPERGSLEIQGTVAYCPQINTYDNKSNVAKLLGIHNKLEALDRIDQGYYLEEDYELIGNDWDIKTRAQQILIDLDLETIGFERTLTSLSGGQKTKCWLARAMLSYADFILLDEPTNNLDSETKDYFFNWLQKTKQGIIIASHDRQLLNYVDEIIELTSIGIQHYGGNHTFYQAQKNTEQQAIKQQFMAAKKQLISTEHTIQVTQEKHERRRKKGRALRKTGKIDKMAANSKQGRCEKTQSKNKIQAAHSLQKAQDKVQLIKSHIEIKERITANLDASILPANKIIINIEELTFGFNKQKPLFINFNLTLLGKDRLSIAGKNGTGKSTLIKIILGHLKPQMGKIYRGFSVACYLDQNLNYLTENLTLVENLCLKNPSFSLQEAYARLAAFNFRNKLAMKRAIELSGGEYMRAGLAISLAAEKQPQLLILDEPTNHLDIRSIEAIEEMLCAYKGTLIVVSHDKNFLSNIGITNSIYLS
ncbi:ABC transporter ATP binding protein [Legionella busanensis]|uniref:ABC transporter ATP binding protein n=1 Tax=Legionella busanensis TaxID=190655 RepID=A0A378JQD7_9GAMM|nr:ABC-F family ATP-binding cassette domain-containing protein [Legionella busanensis]STX52389.1 ABC transporter ATP binding protein [Legionella busanensis]